MECRFSVCDYFFYIKGTENSRVVYEGEEVLNAGHVILCGTTNRSEATINVYALCLQTSALQSPPHKIDGIFLFHDEKWAIESFTCSCKAGNSGRCKHISAVLLSCTRTTLDKLEPLSQTDISCAWSTQKSTTQQRYRPIPITEMDCIKKIVPYAVNNDICTKIYNNLIAALPNSALALHKTGRNNMGENEIDIVERICDSKSRESETLLLNQCTQSTLMMELAHLQIQFVNSCCEDFYKKQFSKKVSKILSETKQSKTEWISERKFRITGSRIYEIYTYKGQDWPRKSYRYFYPKGFSNKFTQHGIKYEDIARRVFINTTGLSVVEYGLVVSEFNPWLGYSPDGIIVNCNQVPEQLLEIKCPFAGATHTLGDVLKKIDYVHFVENTYCLKERHKYYAQVQLGMAMLNVNNCKFIVFCSFDSSMAIIDVPFNYEYIKSVTFIVKEKYYKHMLHNICEIEKH